MKLPKRFVAAVSMMIVGGCHARTESVTADEARRSEVAAQGAEVMPFSLERTTHVFEKVDDGGIQQVVSDDADAEQVRLIRLHLSDEAERFARGDFHDPEMIHGEHMPGLHALVEGHDRLEVTYEDIDLGAQIRYRSADADLIEAIHAWFDAQRSDHGRHAR